MVALKKLNEELLKYKIKNTIVKSVLLYDSHLEIEIEHIRVVIYSKYEIITRHKLKISRHDDNIALIINDIINHLEYSESIHTRLS